MTEPDTTRRQFLLGAGSAATVALAGCSTSAAPDDDGSGGAEQGATTSKETEPEYDETDDHHEEGEDDHEEGAEAEHDETDDHHEEDEDDHEEGADDETTVHEEADEHGGHGHGDPIGDPVDHAEVAMVTGDHGVHFEPHVVRVVPGGTVTFVNESGSHSVAAYHPDNGKQRRVPEGERGWDSGLFTEQGATFEVTLETPGVYDVYCAPHETQGMIGSIIVGEPDAHDQPGLSEPSEDMPPAVRDKITDLNESVNEALGHTH
jgi:plastocyanin